MTARTNTPAGCAARHEYTGKNRTSRACSPVPLRYNRYTSVQHYRESLDEWIPFGHQWPKGAW